MQRITTGVSRSSDSPRVRINSENDTFHSTVLIEQVEELTIFTKNSGIEHSGIEHGSTGLLDSCYTLDEAMLQAGGFGRFQIFVVVFYSLAFTSGSFLVYSYSYLVQFPVYMCMQNSTSTTYEVCDNTQACSSYKYYIEWDNEDSLLNWIEDMNLMCKPYGGLILIQTVYFCGYTFGCFFLPRFSDLYGRKWPFLICMASQFAIYLGILFSKSFQISTGLSFFMGMCTVVRYNGSYVNISEYVHNKWKDPVSILLLCFDCFTSILIALYFKLISKDWLWLQLFGLTLNALALIGACIIPESPEYLYSFYKFKECKKAIEYIAEFNKAPMDSNYSFDLEREMRYLKFTQITPKSSLPFLRCKKKQEEHSRSMKIQSSVNYTMKEFIKDKTQIKNLIIVFILWFLVLLAYNIITSYSNFFPGDQYENAIVHSSIELSSYIIFGYLYTKMYSKKLFYLGFGIAFVGGVGICATNKFTFPHVEMLFAFVSKFGISGAYQGIYMANSLFPVIFSSTTFGICNISGGLSSILSVHITDIENRPLVYLFTTLVLLGIIISKFIKSSDKQ